MRLMVSPRGGVLVFVGVGWVGSWLAVLIEER